MTARQQLDTYLEQVQGRLRLRASLRGAAIVASSALATTIVLVLLANALAFSGASVIAARVVLYLVVAACIAFGCATPLLRLNRRRTAWEAESAVPDFEQRLVTLAERHGDREPFAELLAADTLKIVQRAEPTDLVPHTKLMISLGAALASLGVLVWLILAGPGFLGYGAALLWAGNRGATPLYDLRVTPGDVTVRRNSDQLITAQPQGVQANSARIYARYESTSKWTALPMQSQPGTSNFQFVFAGLPDGVEYYVEAGPLRSRHFHIRVTDVAAVKQIRVTYRFPAWTGMPSAIDDHGGDLHAIEGTEADLELTLDRPLANGVLVLDDGRQIQLSGTGNTYRGTILLEKDGAYHLASLIRGDPVRISEDYFINATKADPPDVVISRPAGDYRASPIEEVTVQAKADDPFGLREFALHYSVNGGSEQTVNLLGKSGQKTADGSTILRLEDFKAVPGDIVSIYATAKDAHTESRTDMYFIQAEPFEREFSQSQQAGGGAGGGGGNAPDEISQRQKEIIGATWKQLGDRSASAESAAQNAKFLSEVQAKLHDQAVSLANRLQLRDLTSENDTFIEFQKDMNAAAEAMTPASETLRGEKWKEALPHEQRALQYLLRAESTFRQIQVAFGSAGGANGGAGGSAGRDLASLFDLELDTQKNQYETAQTADSTVQGSQDIDEALRKLDELARREDQLASQNNANRPDQRWQQELLRREAEQLERQIAQLTGNGQQSSDSANGSPSGESSASGGSASDPRVQQALNQMRQANDDMMRANSEGPQGGGQADARRAAQRLRDATNLLSGTQRQRNSGRLDALAQEADRLAKEQRDQSGRIRDLATRATNGDADGESIYRQVQSLADERQRLVDDLARLESQTRDAVRDLASGDRDAASRLRDALRQLDQSDLDSRVQRSADMLRRGVNPGLGGSEEQIASDLDQLGRQMRDARQALGNTGGASSGDSQSALDQVQQLRERLEALDRGAGGQNATLNRHGAVGQFVNPGGGPNGGPVYGGMNTGNNIYNSGQLPSPPDGYANPVPEPAYHDSMARLDQLRRTLKDDPESQRQVQELIREMQQLDPRRFPGNPAMIEELHNRVLADVDKLALELQRDSEGRPSGQVHSTDSQPVPAGYEDAVADYFRRLSKTP